MSTGMIGCHRDGGQVAEIPENKEFDSKVALVYFSTFVFHRHIKDIARAFVLNTSIMGSVVSAIGYGINSVISAIAWLLESIVRAIVTVIVTIFNVIEDILCCRCCGSRRRRNRPVTTGPGTVGGTTTGRRSRWGWNNRRRGGYY